MVYAVLILDLKLSGSRSLKQKRSMIKPILSRLHKEFNISVAEIGKNDRWDESVIACGLISNKGNSASAQLNAVRDYFESYMREVSIVNYSITLM